MGHMAFSPQTFSQIFKILIFLHLNLDSVVHIYVYLLFTCSTIWPFSFHLFICLQNPTPVTFSCIYSCLDKSTHQHSLILNKCTLSSSWILVLSSDSLNFLHKFSLTLLDDYFTSLSNIHLYHSLLLLFLS